MANTLLKVGDLVQYTVKKGRYVKEWGKGRILVAAQSYPWSDECIMMDRADFAEWQANLKHWKLAGMPYSAPNQYGKLHCWNYKTFTTKKWIRVPPTLKERVADFLLNGTPLQISIG